MADNHPLRHSSRAGGVLEEGCRARAGTRVPPRRQRGRVQVVSRHPAQALEVRLGGERAFHGGFESSRGQNAACLGISHSRANTFQRTIRPRRVDRNGDGTRVETAEKRRDEVETRRINEQHPLTASAALLKQGADPSSRAVELAVTQAVINPLAVTQEGVG